MNQPSKKPGKKPPYKIHGFVILSRERDYGPDEVLRRACRKMLEAIEKERTEAHMVDGSLGVPRDKTVAVTFLNEDVSWLIHHGAYMVAALPEGKLVWCPHCDHPSPAPRCPDCGVLGQIRDIPPDFGGIDDVDDPEDDKPWT